MIEERYIRERVAHFTECQLATLQGCELRKSSSKSETLRHRSIAINMVEFAKSIGLTAENVFMYGPCIRLKERLGSKSEGSAK